MRWGMKWLRLRWDHTRLTQIQSRLISTMICMKQCPIINRQYHTVGMLLPRILLNKCQIHMGIDITHRPDLPRVLITHNMEKPMAMHTHLHILVIRLIRNLIMRIHTGHDDK